MLDKITKYAGILPLIVIAVYIFGYISLNSYLTSFGINENIGLDFKILKLGILFAIIICPVILLCYSDFKVGDYSNINPDVSSQVIDSLHDALGYTILYSIIIDNVLAKGSYDRLTIIMLVFLITGFVLNKVKLKTSMSKILKSILIVIPLFILISSIVFSPTNSLIGFLYFIQIDIFFTGAMFRIFNKEDVIYQFSRIGIIITTICITSTIFGSHVIGKIPAEYGGEKKLIHTYYIDQTDTAKINVTPLKALVKNNQSLRLEVIFDNSDKVYFRMSAKKIIGVPKSYIIGEEIDIPSGYGN